MAGIYSLILQWVESNKETYHEIPMLHWPFDQSNPYDMVCVRGKVVEQVTGDTVEKHIDKLAKKYSGKDEYPGRSPGERRVILKIKPEHVFHMGYTAPS